MPDRRQTPKLGRNQPCWCESGAKYKHCHLGRESESPVPRSQLLSGMRLAMTKPTCLHPDASDHNCRGGYVRSHTVQRSGSLSRIARDHHVYGIKPSLGDLLRTGGQLTASLIGLREASTYRGFCSWHDSQTFRPIETEPFVPTREQAFLIGYRAVCREVYTKQGCLESLPTFRQQDRGRSPAEQRRLHRVLHLYEAGTRIGHANIAHHKTEYDRVLRSGDFSNSFHFVVEVAEPPDVMCSAAFFPEIDFLGGDLQTVIQQSPPPGLVAFAFIATERGGALIFQWLGMPTPVARFVGSLHALPNEQLTNALVRFSFCHCENTFLRPGWWEGLSNEQQGSLLQCAARAAHPAVDSSRDFLVFGGTKLVDWQVSRRILVEQ